MGIRLPTYARAIAFQGFDVDEAGDIENAFFHKAHSKCRTSTTLHGGCRLAGAGVDERKSVQKSDHDTRAESESTQIQLPNERFAWG